MRTLTDATLYTVSGPCGIYYALLDHDSGCVLTAQTQTAAAALANDRDFIIVDQLRITHEKLMKLMPGHDDPNLTASAEMDRSAVAITPDLCPELLQPDTVPAQAGS